MGAVLVVVIDGITVESVAGRATTALDVHAAASVHKAATRRRIDRERSGSNGVPWGDGFDAVDTMWTPTIAHARALPPSLLHGRVNGEYSFFETLRHLVFATDAWLMRVALRASDRYHA
jgi:hypothetical protein